MLRGLRNLIANLVRMIRNEAVIPPKKKDSPKIENTTTSKKLTKEQLKSKKNWDEVPFLVYEDLKTKVTKSKKRQSKG